MSELTGSQQKQRAESSPLKLRPFCSSTTSNPKVSQPSLNVPSDDQDSLDSQHKNQPKETASLQSSDISASNSPKQQNAYMPPLDLFDGKIQEQTQKQGFRRPTTLVKKDLCEPDLICQHESQQNIQNWYCTLCNSHLSQFDCAADDNQGRLHQYLKVCYDNNFLEDFLHAQLDVVTPRENGKDCKQFMKEQRVPDVIYQQYQPSNTTELREYMLYLISKEQALNIKNIRERQAQNGQPQEPYDSEGEQTPTQDQDIDQRELDQEIAQFGQGKAKSLSARLIRYLQTHEENQQRVKRHYQGDVLLFDSIFESGNLLQADRIDSKDYNIYMQVDSNSKGHQQWFYFRVQNTRKKRKYLFNIMNFTKPGVTIVANDNRRQKQEVKQRIMCKSRLSGSQEWKTIGTTQLQFIKTSVARRKKDVLAAGADSDQDEDVEEAFGQETCKAQNADLTDNFSRAINLQSAQQSPSPLKKKRTFYYYALVFEVEFEFDDDEVFFAFSQPYTYSQIVRDVLTFENNLQPTDKSQIKYLYPKTSAPSDTQVNKEPIRRTQGDTVETRQPVHGIQFESKQHLLYYRREELCRSICGLPLWAITIGRDPQRMRKKPVIVITSRVHSGETPASLVFRGILEFLLSDKKEAKLLRLYYTFILVPCLNPDGVVCGNYRNSAAGVDLNRQWINPDEQFHPEIYYTKNLLKRVTEDEKRKIWIYCDLHGHSKKKNSFFYGCNTAANGGFLSWTIVRLFPRIFAQKTHMFSFKDCRFKVEPYKVGTGRVVAWKQFAITHSFTLENSFFGYDFGDDESREFSEEDYFCVGTKFCDSVFEFHYVWKQIQRELNLTNGWLKPRVLNEKTGVPAAQVLQEELARKKREEEKLAGIEQYQLYLRKFYGGNKPAKLQQRYKVGMTVAEDDTEENGDEIIVPLTQDISKSTSKAPKENKTKASKQPDTEVLSKCLEGLVKIQALFRGWLQRKKISGQLEALKLKRKQKKPNQVAITKAPPAEMQSQSDNERRVQISHSLESTSQAGTISRISTRRVELVRRDWRAYFGQEELDTAFQVVEIEKRDIPEEHSSDAGSNSDPSDDNFDENEIYEKVYQLSKDKTVQIIQERQDKQNSLQVQIRSQSPITAPQLYNRIRGGANADGSGTNQDKGLNRHSSRPNELGVSNQNQAQILSQEKLRRQQLMSAQPQNHSKNTLHMHGQNLDPRYLSNQLQQEFMGFQVQNPKFSVRAQSSHKQGDNIISVEYDANHRNYAIIKQSRALQTVLRSSQYQQKRPMTSHVPDMYVGAPPQSQKEGTIQRKAKDFQGGQFKFQHYSQSANTKANRRENITQVIKDCFITRQCVVQRPKSKQKVTQKTSVQPSQLAYGQTMIEMQKANLKISQQRLQSSIPSTTYKLDTKSQRPMKRMQPEFSIQTVIPQYVLTPDRNKSPLIQQLTMTEYKSQQPISIQHHQQARARIHSSLQRPPLAQQQMRIPTHQAPGGSDAKMNSIRVVKEPNSNMTYLQSYSAQKPLRGIEYL